MLAVEAVAPVAALESASGTAQQTSEAPARLIESLPAEHVEEQGTEETVRLEVAPVTALEPAIGSAPAEHVLEGSHEELSAPETVSEIAAALPEFQAAEAETPTIVEAADAATIEDTTSLPEIVQPAIAEITYGEPASIDNATRTAASTIEQPYDLSLLDVDALNVSDELFASDESTDATAIPEPVTTRVENPTQSQPETVSDLIDQLETMPWEDLTADLNPDPQPAAAAPKAQSVPRDEQWSSPAIQELDDTKAPTLAGMRLNEGEQFHRSPSAANTAPGYDEDDEVLAVTFNTTATRRPTGRHRRTNTARTAA
jgi:hypothetical protein